MSEVRKVIILVLVVLFIFVGVGVAISRISSRASVEESASTTGIGTLQQIFSDFVSGETATQAATRDGNDRQEIPTPVPTEKVVVTRISEDTTYSFEGVVQPTSRPKASPAPARTSTPAPITQRAAQELTAQKGATPTNIPATGTPGYVLLLALSGVFTGLYLHRKV